MVHALSKSPHELRQEVLDAHLCTGRGARLGLCPHLTQEEAIDLVIEMEEPALPKRPHKHVVAPGRSRRRGGRMPMSHDDNASGVSDGLVL